MYAQYSFSLSLNDNQSYGAQSQRWGDAFLPSKDFSIVTNKKLTNLRALAETMRDTELLELHDAINHYVQIARQNNEYVLWKYDINLGGLVLGLKKNSSRILYYG